MKIGPKYKIARRLGAPIFEKTQNQKFALSEEKKLKNKRPRQKTDYGLQLAEKQKARMFYGITEKQFKNYVKSALAQKQSSPSLSLISKLESRLDNMVWRIGIASTHGAGRQMVSHGHICINGKKVRVPSFNVSVGDVISIREESKKSVMFATVVEKGLPKEIPSWISFDNTTKEATLKSEPRPQENELLFSSGQIIGFYQR